MDDVLVNPFNYCPHCNLPLDHQGVAACSSNACPIGFREYVRRNDDGTIRAHSIIFEVAGYIITNYYDEPKTYIHYNFASENALYITNRWVTWNYGDLQALENKVKMMLVFQ